MQRLEIIGPDRKDIGIKRFRLRQSSLTMKIERLLDHLWKISGFGS